MTIDSFDIVFYTAIFIFPGFIISSVVDTTNPAKEKSENIAVLKYLGYSIINCACLSWLYKILLQTLSKHPIQFWLFTLVSTVIGSLILGVVIAFIKQRNVTDWLLERLHIRSIHPTPTAWDYIFSQRKSSFVIVTLNDGSEVRGWYSSCSFTSSVPDDRDIFIEQLYRVDKTTDEWQISENSAGIYIPSNQIKYIEFKEGGNSDARE